MNAEKFLAHLADVLNKIYSTDSFRVVNGFFIHIYSPQFGIAVYNLVKNTDDLDQTSYTDLFRELENLFKYIKVSDVPITRFLVVSTNNEEEMIFDFIEFQRKKKNLKTIVEFWGWETIRKIFEKFPPRTNKPIIDDKTVYLNFIPTPNIYTLFGIDNILSQIEEKLDSSITPVVLHNPVSGTGKSVLALSFIYHYDYQKKFDHYAYVPVNYDIKLDFINAFDGKIGFEYKIALGVDENFDILLDLLANVEGRNLLIIDGIKEISLTNFLIELNEKLKWKILVVSDFRIYGFENIYIDHPIPEDARGIFLYFFKNLKKSKLLDDLLDSIYYHPFTIVFLAKTLSHFHEELSLENLLALSKEMEKRVFHLGDYIDRRLSKSQIVLVRTILKNLMAIFDYQARKFSPMEKKILTLASVLPHKFMSFSFLKDLIQDDASKLDDAILLLISKGWLDADRDKFIVSPLIRIVLHKKLKPSPEKLNYYIVFLTSKLKKLGSKEARFWLDNALALIQSLKTADVHMANIFLLIARNYEDLGNISTAQKFYQYTGRIMEILFQATGDLKILETLVAVWVKADDYQRALYFANNVIENIELGKLEVDDEKLVNWYRFVAELYLRVENYEKAIELADNALDTAMMVYDKSDPRLKEVENFHKRLSNEFNNKIKSQEKIQWIKRFFI